MGGLEHSVPISLSRFTQMLNPQQEGGYDRLPPGTRYVAESSAKRTVKLLIEFPPAKRLIKVQHDYSVRGGIKCDVAGVALPGGVFVFDLMKSGDTYTINGSRLFGVAKTIADTTDRLYRFPLPNLGHGDARICWGGNSVHYAYAGLAAIEGAAKVYFESNFNDHWFYKDSVSAAFDWEGQDVRAVELFFQKLA